MNSLIAELQLLEKDYRPNNRITELLGTKCLVLVVGPAGTGKSTIMSELANRDSRFSRVGGPVTRPRRPDDEPGLYRYLPHTEQTLKRLLAKARASELVQYAVHPTTGRVYATELEDYAGEYNCKDVLGHAVSVFRNLPVKTSYTFSLVCEPKQWRRRLRNRYPDSTDPDLQKRVNEARLNLEWSLMDNETVWVRNNDGELDQAVTLIRDYTTGAAEPDSANQRQLRALAEQMLTSVNSVV